MSSFRVLPFLIVILLGSLPASASSLTAYNLVLSGNFIGSTHVEGAAFIGGNLTATGMSDFNHHGNTPAGLDALSVMGQVSGQMKILNQGTGVYGSLAAGSNVDCNGNTGCAGKADSLEMAALAAELQSLVQQMNALSSGLDALTTNGVFNVTDPNQARFRYDGSESTAVFDITTADLVKARTLLLDVKPTTQQIVINVTGNIASSLSGINFGGNWPDARVIWNFTDATTLKFGSLTGRGVILAPSADVFGSAGFEAPIYAKSLDLSDGLREIHWESYTPPDLPRPIPEPTMTLLALAGIAAAGLRARRVRR